MKCRVLRAILIGVFLSLASLAITTEIEAQGPVVGTFPVPYSSTTQLLGSTSGTVLTGTTTVVYNLYCTNTTSSAATLNVTDTAGNSIVSALSIAGHDFKTVIDSAFGYYAAGIKWWSGTANALSCYLGGKQPQP